MRIIWVIIFLLLNQYSSECRSGYKAKVKIGYKSKIDGRFVVSNPNLEEVLYFDEKYIYYKKGMSRANVFIKNSEIAFIETDGKSNYGFGLRRTRNPMFSDYSLSWKYTGNSLKIGNRKCLEVQIFSSDLGDISHNQEHALAYVDTRIPSNNMLLGATDLPGFIVQLEMIEIDGNERKILIHKFDVEKVKIPDAIQNYFDEIQHNSFYSHKLNEPLKGDEFIPEKILSQNSNCYPFGPKLRLVSNFMFDFNWPTENFQKYTRSFNGKEMISVSNYTGNNIYTVVKGKGSRKDSVVIEFDKLDDIVSINNFNEMFKYSIASDTICMEDTINNYSYCYYYNPKENSIITHRNSEFYTKSTFDLKNRLVRSEYDSGDFCTYEYNGCQLIKESWNLDTKNSSIYEYYENGLMKSNKSENSSWKYEYEIVNNGENSFVLLVLISKEDFKILSRNTYNEYGNLIEVLSISDSTNGNIKMWSYEYDN